MITKIFKALKKRLGVKSSEVFLVEAFRANEKKPFAKIKTPDLFLAKTMAKEFMEYNPIFESNNLPHLMRRCQITKPNGELIK